jgi:hypothetical protein
MTNVNRKFIAEIANFKSLQRSDNYSDVLDNVGPASESDLNDLQQAYAQSLIDIVGQFGEFPQTGPGGCHYESISPYASEGITCSECVFYVGAGDCGIVDGQVDPLGVCRFYVVPDEGNETD